MPEKLRRLSTRRRSLGVPSKYFCPACATYVNDDQMVYQLDSWDPGEWWCADCFLRWATDVDWAPSW